MTIEIEAGAPQSECSMKRSCAPQFFEDVFLIYFSSTKPFRSLVKSEHSSLECECSAGDLFPDLFARVAILPGNGLGLGTVGWLLHLKSHDTHVRED